MLPEGDRLLLENENEITTFKVLERSKAAGFPFPPELFIAAHAVSAELLLSLIRKSWNTRSLPERRRRIWSLGFRKKVPVLSGTNEGIFACSLSITIMKNILECIKEHLEGFINRMQGGFPSESFSSLVSICLLRVIGALWSHIISIKELRGRTSQLPVEVFYLFI